jgi:hypothetical protein
LEFHCTVPLQPDRIQEILYGETLQPFLCGERIAQTLIQRSKLPVSYVLTNHAAVLPVQPLTSTPVIYVFDVLHKPASDSTEPVREISDELSESLKLFGIDNAHLRTKPASADEMPQIPGVSGFDTGIWKQVRIGNRLIAIPNEDEDSWERSLSDIKECARSIDLLEPFTRIRLALEEAQKAA